ncbi:hypothetical protein ASG87_17450 [Frateuria sp. Soil773]|uniref:hypothetical protein n=1 Tax=Frateuria sp. Soil773 TaxID=1736407 RepID=UPI0006FAC225|nr:hypothetical protein [Frateuria sp. Soil773]KRE94396.1 hypothetical protein ASG87_17450 [Frateuria sp. Soil773]
MMHHRTPTLIALSLAAALALSACGKHDDTAATTDAAPPPPAAQPATAPAAPDTMAPASSALSVTSVDLGTAVDANNKVAAAADSFTPKDTIYASVNTTGSGSGTLSAKWTYQDGQTVMETNEPIAPTGPVSTAFHISKPDGFPAGSYKVDIALDGKPVVSKDFTVK